MIDFFQKTGVSGICISAAGLISLYLFIKNTVFITMVERGFYCEFSRIENNEKDILDNDIECRNPIMLVLKDIAGVHIDHSGDLRAEVAYLFNKYFIKTGRALVVLKLISSVSPPYGAYGDNAWDGVNVPFPLSRSCRYSPSCIGNMGGSAYNNNGTCSRNTFYLFLLLPWAQGKRD